MSARLACAALLCAAALPAVAQEGNPGTPDQAEVLLRVEVGKVTPLDIAMGAPVTCDDGDVVERTAGPGGLGLRGLKPGATLCSVLTAAFTTVRYRVQVVEPPHARSK